MRNRVLSSILLLFLIWPTADLGAAEKNDGVWLGVWLGDALDGGAEVVALAPGGPAHRAGLHVGDIIVEADGVPVSEQAILGDLLQRREPGGAVKLSLLRSGTDILVEVVPQRRPEVATRPLIAPRVEAAPAPSLVGTALPDRLQSPAYRLIEGIRVAEITPGLREHYGAPADVGVLVVGISDADESATLGLRVGDVLVRLAGRDIRDQRQIERTLTTWPGNRPLEVRFVREREMRTLRVEGRTERSVAEGRTRFDAAQAQAERKILVQRLESEIARLRHRIQELERQLDAVRHQD